MKGILLAVLALPFVGCCAHMCGGERLRDSVASIQPAARGAASSSFPTPKVVSAARPVSASRATKAAAAKPIRLGVYFATNDDRVGRFFNPELKRAADFLARNPKASLQVQGHADNKGPAELNRILSKRRAEAVRQALIERFKADPARVSAVGYGSARPLADNKTPDGRARNRRAGASIVLPAGK